MSSTTLDTDVLIAGLDRSDAHHAGAAALLRELIADDEEIVICTVNYAETLVRPAENARTLDAAADAIAALGVRRLAPSAATARDAARHRALGVSLADGFALATAQAQRSRLASFDQRVRRAADELEITLAPA